MRRLLVLLFALGSVPMTPAPVLAQPGVSYDGCMLMGRPIPSIPTPAIDDIAQARMDPAYGPVILYNPAIVNRARPETRTFFYFHECAHHALGHTLGFSHPETNEQQADCWAVRELFARRLFGVAQLQTVQAEVATSPGDRTHLPGPARGAGLWACLGR